MSILRVQEVEPDEWIDGIKLMHEQCFDPPVDIVPIQYTFEDARWWVATEGKDSPVAYLGMILGWQRPATAYLLIVGVLEPFWGRGLQRRLMRCAAIAARKAGATEIVSYTRDNPPSANNFVRLGYLTYWPAERWATEDVVYWRKAL